MPVLYQLINLGSSQWNVCPDVLKKQGVDFVNETDIDKNYPLLFLYWGWSKSDYSYHGPTNLSSLANDVKVLPVVSNVANFNQFIPEDIHSINAFDYGKNGEQGLVNYILEYFGIINQTKKVFISYRRTEASEVAHQLFDSLQQKGYYPFLDCYSIQSGVPFQQYLRNELADADVFVYLNSPDYQNSPYTMEEKDCAQKMNMGVVQVSLWGARKDDSFINAAYIDVKGPDEKNTKIYKKWIDAIVEEVEKRRAEFFAYRRNVLMDSYQKKCSNAIVGGINNDLLINSKKNEVVALCLHIPKSIDLQKAEEKLNPLAKGFKKVLLYDAQFCRRDVFEHITWLNKNLSKVIETRDINA